MGVDPPLATNISAGIAIARLEYKLCVGCNMLTNAHTRGAALFHSTPHDCTICCLSFKLTSEGTKIGQISQMNTKRKKRRVYSSFNKESLQQIDKVSGRVRKLPNWILETSTSQPANPGLELSKARLLDRRKKICTTMQRWVDQLRKHRLLLQASCSGRYKNNTGGNPDGRAYKLNLSR